MKKSIFSQECRGMRKDEVRVFHESIEEDPLNVYKGNKARKMIAKTGVRGVSLVLCMVNRLKKGCHPKSEGCGIIQDS
jgi:hypothetical protein